MDRPNDRNPRRPLSEDHTHEHDDSRDRDPDDENRGTAGDARVELDDEARDGPEDVLAKARRREAAQALAEAFPQATAEEKEAFAVYCDEAAIGKRRLKRSVFEAFLQTYRHRAHAGSRKQRTLTLLQRYGARLTPETALEIHDETFNITVHGTFAHREVGLRLEAKATRRFDDVEVSDVVLDEPERAAEWLAGLERDLRAAGAAAVETARATLENLIDGLLEPAQLAWLGGESVLRERYLDFPSMLTVGETLLAAEQRRTDARAQATTVKLRRVSDRLARLPEARNRGKTLQYRYRESFPLLTTAFVTQVFVEKSLEARDIDRLAAALEGDFQKAVDAVLAPVRNGLVAKIADQIGALSRNIAKLPHIELLTEAQIIETVTPFYSGLDREFKKRRARSALVAIEERAREAKYQGDVERLNEHRESYADPASYYPLARANKRKLLLFVGPTNSGKTWRSLNELAKGESGAYLAPLRLLALEGQEEMEKRGKTTSFLTGEERDIKPGSRFISSTIEMLSYDNPVDAVVVDEVQLLADERRGWAWLAAVLGAPAKTVIMTGSPDCVEMVKALAEYLGEELTIETCTRYNELRVADEPLLMRDLVTGTAVVCFSRRDVLRLKTNIELNTGLKVAVVYGNLSPQVRREEARRFRAGEADVLVATDAIAMGLNLPIKEVVFYATEKYDGESVRPLTHSEIRQIGGRAGRYGFASFGVVNALSNHGLEQIREALRTPAETLEPPFYVAPGPNHVRIIGEVLGTESLERILTFFERAMHFSDERFARSNIDELSYLSTFVDERLPELPLAERLQIASAPVDIKSDTVMGWFIERMLPAFKAARAGEEEDAFSLLDSLFDDVHEFEHEDAAGPDELRRAEDYLTSLTVYAWLAYRHAETFSRLVECEAARETVNAFIERSLRKEVSKRCAACNVKLPNDHEHRLCDRCHATARTRRGGSGSGNRGGRRHRA